MQKTTRKKGKKVRRIAREAQEAHAKGEHPRVEEMKRRIIDGHGCPKATTDVLVELVVTRERLPHHFRVDAWKAFAKEPSHAGLRRIARSSREFGEAAFDLLVAGMTTKQLRKLARSLPGFRHEITVILHLRKGA